MALTFDGPTSRISISASTTLSVRDLWSRAVDWWLTGDNSKYAFPLEQVGGNDIDLGAGTKIPIYAFLRSGWRIKPQESSHTLNVTDGVLLVDGGGDPFVNTLGSFVVRINYQQPVQAISFSTGGGGTAPTAEQNAAAVWQYLIEAGIPAEVLVRLMSATLINKATGVGTPIERYRDIADTKDRLVVTFDAEGNRLGVVRDGS
jgi:hypothetical protein